MPSCPVFSNGFVRQGFRIALLFAVAAAPAGCGWLIQGGPLQPPSASESSSTQRSPARLLPELPSSLLPTSSDRELLARDGWIRALPSAASQQPPDPRWRYPALEELLARPALHRPNLGLALLSPDPVAAGNAAIGLARLGDGRGLRQLAAAVRTPTAQMSLPMRCAAAEALGMLRQPSPADTLRELLDQYGRHEGAARTGYLPELHAELLRALGRQVDPGEDRRFAAALRSPSASVRLEAVRAWSDAGRGDLPDAVVRLRVDQDPRVRAAVLGVLARRRHHQAHRLLAAALDDYDAKVRLAAIEGLGVLGGDAARTTLEGLLETDRELLAAAAVTALAQMGAQQPALKAAGHKSWRVRLAVAHALARFPNPSASAVARELVEEDPSSEVHRGVLAGIAEWPLELAGPALFAALAKNSPELRRLAAEQLTAKWAPARDFPLQAPAHEQAAALGALRQRYRQEVGLVHADAPARAAAEAHRSREGRIPHERFAEVEHLLRQLGNPRHPPAQQRWAVQRLIDFGPDLPEILEGLVVDRGRVVPDILWRDVLPRYGAEFVALDELTSEDITVRRRAASKLAELGAGRALGRLVRARLVWQMTTESDHLVWIDVLKAVAHDPSRAAAQLAYAAAGHKSAEVRRRACNHLADHAGAEHARVLAGLLQDPHQSVVLAALEALGAAERLPDPGAIEPLLGHPEETVRLKAATVLARFGHASGREALKRLAWSGNLEIRAGAATAMGRLADHEFIPALMRLLDDRIAVRRAALASLPHVVGQDVAALADPRPASISEQVHCWKRWWQRQPGAGSQDQAAGYD